MFASPVAQRSSIFFPFLSSSCKTWKLRKVFKPLSFSFPHFFFSITNAFIYEPWLCFVFKNNFHVFPALNLIESILIVCFSCRPSTMSRVAKTKDINQHLQHPTPRQHELLTWTALAPPDNNENRFDSIVFACISHGGCWLVVCLKDAYFIVEL